MNRVRVPAASRNGVQVEQSGEACPWGENDAKWSRGRP